MPDDRAQIRGDVVVTVDGVEHKAQNLITNNGLLLLASLLANDTSPPSSTGWYVMLGLSDTQPTGINTQLFYAITTTWKQAIKDRNTNTVAFIASYGTGEANGYTQWNEIGLWYGATSTANSGTMMARVINPFTKTNTQIVTVQWTITIIV